MSAWAAQQWAPIVADAVPFILGFFIVLGILGQEKPRTTPIVKHQGSTFAKLKSNEQIIKEMKQ